MMSRTYNGKLNMAWLYKNGDQVAESQHQTFSGNLKEQAEVYAMGGRQVIMKVNKENSISLRTTQMDTQYFYTYICFDYISEI